MLKFYQINSLNVSSNWPKLTNILLNMISVWKSAIDTTKKNS